jgi:hypothetical protein
MKRSTLLTIVFVVAVVAAAVMLRAFGGGFMDTIASIHGR